MGGEESGVAGGADGWDGDDVAERADARRIALDAAGGEVEQGAAVGVVGKEAGRSATKTNP